VKTASSITLLSPSSCDNTLNASEQDQVILFLEKEWDVGGGSIYDINAGNLLTMRNIGRVYGLSLKPISRIGVVAEIAGSRIHHPSTNFLCSRTRVRWGLRHIANIKPSHIITTINPETCECLRGIPRDVIRFGVLHTMDREGLEWARVYEDLFDKIICVSCELKHLAISLAPELSDKILVIPPIITKPEKGYIKSTNTDKPLMLLYLGRFEEASKRIKSIPRIALALKNMGIPFKWTVAGEGREQQFLESEINRLRLDNEINIIKPIHPSLLGELFKVHDVIVSTSDSESFGMSVHEAISWGLVPIAGKTSGKLDTTIIKAGGFLVDPDFPDEFAKAMEILANNRPLLATLSKRGANTILEILENRNDLTDWPSCFKAIQEIKKSSILNFNQSPLIPIPRYLVKQSKFTNILQVSLYSILNLIDLASLRLSDRLFFTLRNVRIICFRGKLLAI
jgi:glycosyltransferase involved in cell wall biosynthesis